MQDISFRNWRLSASTVDTDVLRLDIDALDGSDIIESGELGAAGERGGEQYTLALSTQRIEEVHRRSTRARSQAAETEEEADEAEADWLSDEDETIYLRGWEVTAFVDEEGLLHVTAERGDDADIYELEPIESGVPLGPRVTARLAAEQVDEDEEEEKGQLEEEEQDELDTFDEYEEADELEGWDDDLEDEEEEEDEDDGDFEDIFGRENDAY